MRFVIDIILVMFGLISQWVITLRNAPRIEEELEDQIERLQNRVDTRG